MANKVRTHMGGDAPTDASLRPKHLTKQEFGRRLYTLMVARNWNQSELARRADLARDSVSTYVRGISLPEPKNLRKLAEALEMEPSELLPNTLESAIDEDVPSLELKVSTSDPRVAWLRVNRLVSTPTAMNVIEILNKDDADN